MNADATVVGGHQAIGGWIDLLLGYLIKINTGSKFTHNVWVY